MCSMTRSGLELFGQLAPISQTEAMSLGTALLNNGMIVHLQYLTVRHYLRRLRLSAS